MKPSTFYYMLVFVMAGLIFPTINYSQNEHPTVSGFELEHRLITISTDFKSDKEMDRVLDLVDRAYDACFNGIVLESNVINYLEGYNSKLDKSLNSSFRNRWRNLEYFLKYAKYLDMQVIPKAVQLGGVSILSHDANLAEGIPVKDVPVIVNTKRKKAKLTNDPTDIFPLKNGNFNRTDANGFEDWEIIHANKVSAYNKVVFSGNDKGASYLKIKDPSKFKNGNVEIRQTVTGLKTYREYQIKMRIKTRNFKKPKNFSVEVFNRDTKQYLQHNKPVSSGSARKMGKKFIQPSADWAYYYVTFNTLENTELTINIRNWNGGSGQLMIDYIEITPTLFQNVLTRTDAPIVIKDEKGNILKNEKNLQSKIFDKKLGTDAWHGHIDAWHEKPDLTLSKSNFKNGQKLFVSYYSAATIKNRGSYASLNHPKVYQIINDQLDQLEYRFNRKNLNMLSSWFFNHDEHRIHGWDHYSNGASPGENLMKNFNQSYAHAKELKKDSKVFVWNDMFDPYHNGYSIGENDKPYYLVKGDWSTELDSLADDVVIANWIGAPEVKKPLETIVASFKNFDVNGHDQIVCGFYDNKEFYTENLLAELSQNDIKNIKGVMYTTWTKDYNDLEKWANTLWGDWCDTQ